MRGILKIVSGQGSGATKKIEGILFVMRKHRIWPFKRGNSEGFTLVEVLISLAILSIVTVALLLLFNQSFDGIINSGKKAKGIYENQESLEDSIAGGKASGTATEEPLDLDMTFTDEGTDPIDIKVPGKLVTKEKLAAFIPNSEKVVDDPPSDPEYVAVTGVDLNTNSLILDEGATYQLKATVRPENATNKEVTWKSNKPNKLSVDNDGVVNGKLKGDYEITVTIVDRGRRYTATCLVTVTK